ncbi:DUF637 domain-containing protein [Pseudomonas sp. BN606]|uniref:DUF637 domain-containing protein n=1 Tax=Pseudomonas sp. BN606 TaxID=2567894 RepID=UPI0024566C31|nr:DUF637 domain-containing protein [Pseudomonas sp. BN606]
MFDKLFGTQTNTFADKVNNVDLGTLEGVGNFAGNQLAQSGTAAALNKLMGRDASFRDALQGALYNTLAAAAFCAVGDFTEDKWVCSNPADSMSWTGTTSRKAGSKLRSRARPSV